MNYIVLTPNADGKFEFTKEELQKLLDEAYEQGEKDLMSNFTFDTKDYKWHNNWLDNNLKIDVTCEGARQ